MTNSLHRKIAQIQGELKTVPRNGLNGFHKYKYATEQDVLDTIRPLCAKASISLVTDCTSFEIAKGAATVLVRLTLTDGESGESVSIQMPGYAEDKGDKAVYKAITGATKYAFWKCFGLSTGDDPETEDEGAKSRTDLPDSKRASPLHHVKSYPAINQLQPHEQIMAVMNRIGIDPKQQPIIGKKALFACYPGTKSQDLTPVQTFEVIRILLLQYGNEAGVFKAHDHCLAAFNKVIREQHLEGADALSVTSAWLEDLQQRTQERLRAEQSENA